MSEHSTHIEEHRDDEGAKLGMWIFIFTELLLFGGLFLVYAVFRAKYSKDFHDAALELNTFAGTLNTVILLVSSMTVAMSITAVQLKNKGLAKLLILATLLLAFAFLVNKYFEWSGKIHHGIYPGSELVLSFVDGQRIFFGLYYFMTGLHVFHVIVGMIVLTVIYFQIKSEKIHDTDYVLLENGGLYWHLVDLIWIFLFPLLYLIT